MDFEAIDKLPPANCCKKIALFAHIPLDYLKRGNLAKVNWLGCRLFIRALKFVAFDCCD